MGISRFRTCAAFGTEKGPKAVFFAAGLFGKSFAPPPGGAPRSMQASKRSMRASKKGLTIEEGHAILQMLAKANILREPFSSHRFPEGYSENGHQSTSIDRKPSLQTKGNARPVRIPGTGVFLCRRFAIFPEEVYDAGDESREKQAQSTEQREEHRAERTMGNGNCEIGNMKWEM